MQTFKKYLEAFSYSPTIDGKALEPTTISGAEVQIKHLSSHLRFTFRGLPNIEKVTELLDQAANMLDADVKLSGKERNTEITGV